MPDAEKCRLEVERILHSEVFRNREPLRRLLAFLAEKTLDGTADALKEYTIGVEVFAKAADYDPQRDASCRVQAGKLRQRLEEYYRGEGSASSLVVELPKRQFTLVFHETQPGRKPYLGRIEVQAALAAAVALLLVGAWWAGRQSVSAGRALAAVSSPADQIWKPFWMDKRPAAICLGVPLFVRHSVLRLRDSHLNEMDSADARERLDSIRKLMKADTVTPSYEYTGIGEAVGALLVTQMLARHGLDVEVKRSNSLTWDDLKNENLVFLGSAKFNPQLRQLPITRTFLVEDSLIKNLAPQAGEPASYGRVLDGAGNVLEDHALVSRLPGLHGRGVILLLDGISTSSAWAAAEFVTHADSVQDLVSRLGGLAPYFQVVIRVKYRDMVPVEVKYVNHRVLAPTG